MEKRIGVVAVLITDKSKVNDLNTILTNHNEIIIGRQGMPLREKGINVISLIVEGNTDQIGALTGKIGKISGVQVKSVLTSYKETINE